MYPNYMNKTFRGANADPGSAVPADGIGWSDSPAEVVDVYQPEARARWASCLQVSERQLMEAVRCVGVELRSVRLYLSERRSDEG